MADVLGEILSGDALGLSDAAALFPGTRGEGRMCSSTVWRWIATGARAVGGEVVKLEAARIGTRWLTSRAALARFSAALTPSAEPETAAVPKRAPKARSRAADAASKRLADAGA